MLGARGFEKCFSSHDSSLTVTLCGQVVFIVSRLRKDPKELGVWERLSLAWS